MLSALALLLSAAGAAGMPAFGPQGVPPTVRIPGMIAPAAPARVKRYVSIPGQSTARVSASLGPAVIPGRFERFRAVALIDEPSHAASALAVELETDSIVSESWLVPTALMKAELRAGTYPLATLKTARVQPIGPGVVDLDSELTIFGQPHRTLIRARVGFDASGIMRALGSFSMAAGILSGTLDFDLRLRPED